MALISAVSLLACTPEAEDDTFRATTVDYDGVSALTLTFSDPIANADEIDPNDFRISVGMTSRSAYGEAYTMYSDLGTYGVDVYDMRHGFMSASLGGSANELVLEMSTPLGTEICDIIGNTLEYFEMYVGDGDIDLTMLLHYAGRDIPVQSEHGETLADIGPDWVLSDQSYMTDYVYGFTKLDPLLRIPCP